MLRRSAGLLFAFLLISAGSVAYLQRQAIADWLRLRGYTPPARVAELAAGSGMNDYGRKLFYVYHPQIQDAGQFNSSCSDHEHTIVIGCYVSGDRIYVYDVKDERLAGIHEVTAAHEMLHAAYERLGDSERQWLDARLADFVETQLQSQRIKNNIAAYQARDPDVVPNELHSILGTEVENLTQELEEYYGRYFSDRGKVVALSQQYESLFETLKQQIERYDSQLASLRQQIEGLEADLRLQQGSIEAEASRLDRLAADGNYGEYNAGVPAYNQKINAYNTNVGHYKALVEEFNRTVETRNDLAYERNDLVKSLDSKYEKL